MVNEPRILVNNDFFTADIDALYESLCKKVDEHRNRTYMACCRRGDSRDSYIRYGSYTRRVTDARVTGYRDGIPELEVDEVDNFEIHRLQHKSCGHTHGLMFELFIPYQKYTVRFVLLLLHRYFHSKETMEALCNEFYITISTFKKWLKWLGESMPILTKEGLVQDEKENREKLKKWICRIWEHPGLWQLKSLAGQNLALFQHHRMPAHCLSYDIRKYREIPGPTDLALDSPPPVR